MEKVSRCQLYFPRGFVVASAVFTFISPLDESFGTMPRAKRAVRWHREEQAVVHQVPWAEGSEQSLHLALCPRLVALSPRRLAQKHTNLHGTYIDPASWDIACPASWMASREVLATKERGYFSPNCA